MASKIPSVVLSNGVKMPQFGLGTFLTKPGELEPAITAALDAGYRHFDTAELYNNEEELGDVLQKYYKTGKVSRKDLFLTTKLASTHNRAEDVEPTLRESLKKLQTDYVDLYLLHFPVSHTRDFSTHDTAPKLLDTWKAVEAIYKKGLAKAIGVSNFSNEQIARINAVAEVPVHVSQVEAHLSFQQIAHLEFAKKNNIAVTAYAPLGSPGRAPFFQMTGMKQVDYEAGVEPLKSALVTSLAKKYGKSPAQILLRHLLQRGFIIIPKSTNPKRIRENIDIFDFELTSDEVDKLNQAPQAPRLYPMAQMIGHPEDAFAATRQSETIVY